MNFFSCFIGAFLGVFVANIFVYLYQKHLIKKQVYQLSKDTEDELDKYFERY